MTNEVTEKINETLNSFQKIPVKLPPQFISLANYQRGLRFVVINYQGTKAMIGDGLITSPFPFYQAYNPLISHPSIVVYTHQFNFGSDDAYPTHALLLDSQEMEIYLVTTRQGDELLRLQYETVENPNEIIMKSLEKMRNPQTLADYQEIGMFQFFAPQVDRSKEVEEMVNYLNQFLPEDLRDFYKKHNLL